MKTACHTNKRLKIAIDSALFFGRIMMDLNTFGNPPLSPSPLQQDPNLMLSSQPAYPVSNQSQQLPFYPNATPQYPPGKIPHDQQQHLAQQQQHQRFSFGATPITQPVGSGGAMMPSGLPQSSGMLTAHHPCFPWSYFYPYSTRGRRTLRSSNCGAVEHASASCQTPA